MGFFDRWKRSSVRRYEFEDSPFASRSVDRPIVRDEVRSRRTSDNWLWLLLIPLFLLLGLGAYSYLSNTSGFQNGFATDQPNFLSNLFNKDADRGENNDTNSGLQFGVGGAPTTPTPTPTIAPAPMQQTENQLNTTTSDTDQESGRVQSASERRIPSVAPATGRGR